MRKFVYLAIVAVCAVGIFVFLGKKNNPEVPATPVAEDTSAEQSGTAGEGQAVDGQHAANQLPSDFGKLSDFTLSNQAGQEFTSAAMKGKVYLVNFFFSKCEGPCPLMNKKMEAFQEKFANDADIKLLSVSVDPANDTVEVIKAYSETFKANPEKWSFATGSKEVINDIMEKQMKLAVSEDLQLHTTRIALIDKEGNIKGYFDSASEEELSKLEEEARKLLAPAA